MDTDPSFSISVSAWEALARASSRLWSEDHFEHVVEIFREYLADQFGVDSLMHIRGRYVDASIQWPELPDPIRETCLLSSLRLIDFKDPEHSLQMIELDGTSYNFIGMPWGESHVDLFIWKSQVREHEPYTFFKVKTLELLCLQLKSVSSWLCRLDHTQELLYRDDLTGLYNYRYLDVALDIELRRSSRFQSSFCLLFIDLDDFKPINDTYGHLSGSYVLQQVATVLKAGLREVDSVFRYGGDEFVVLLLESDVKSGLLAAERMRQRIETCMFRVDGDKTTRVTASIGVSCCPDHGRSKKTLLKMADESMYRSKRGGKNQVVLCSPTGSRGDAFQPPID